MIIDGKITKKFIFNNDHGGNVNFDIKPYNLYDFFTKTAPLKKIPDYQRPYSWKKKNVQDFLNDILDTLVGTKNKNSWFLGCIYVTKESNFEEAAYILDGQQRITTLQIIFNELLLSRFYDTSINFKSTFNDAIGCINDCLYMKEAGQKVVRFSTDPITNELLKKYLRGSLKVDSNESYKKFIIKFDEELSSSVNESKSHRTLYNNIHLVRRFIYDKLISLKGDFPQKIKLEEINDVSDRLQDYINTILYSFWLINIPLIKENISEEIFESLNNRGKPLSMVDKFQFRSLTKGFDKTDEIRKYWSKIFKLIDKLQSSAINITFIKSDEQLIKLYFESKIGSELDNDEYLIKFEKECLKDYDSLTLFFNDLIKIMEFLIDISNPDTSEFINSFKPQNKDKKARAITQVMLSFLNNYNNPIRLIFSLIANFNYKSDEKFNTIQGIWEILKLSYYKNIILGEQPNKVRKDFNFYIKNILNEDKSYFMRLFYELTLIQDDDNHQFYRLFEDNQQSLQFDNVKYSKPSQGKIALTFSLDSKSKLLNTHSNPDSTLVLLLFVLLENHNSLHLFSSTAFKHQNLEHVFPRAYKNHWLEKKYTKGECLSFLDSEDNEYFHSIITNSLNQDIELRDYKTQPYQQPQSLIQWIGNKLLIQDLANKRIGNKSFDFKIAKYEDEQYILPKTSTEGLELNTQINFNYETILKRSSIIVNKISEDLLCSWDSI